MSLPQLAFLDGALCAFLLVAGVGVIGLLIQFMERTK